MGSSLVDLDDVLVGGEHAREERAPDEDALVRIRVRVRVRVRVRGRGRGRVRGKALLGTDRPLTLPLLLPLRRCLVPIDP